MRELTLEAMRQSVIEGSAEAAAGAARRGLECGIGPLEAINEGFVPGMTQVGDEFARRAMFLPDMMASAEAMHAAMAVLEPELKKCGLERRVEGTVVLGSARGDIHEIGKTLVATLLTAHGFRVHDLGVNVAAEEFAAQARKLGADIVGVSALLTTTMRAQKSVVEALAREGLRPRVKIIVGGAPVTRQWAQEIGADGYGKDAAGAVSLAKELMLQKA